MCGHRRHPHTRSRTRRAQETPWAGDDDAAARAWGSDPDVAKAWGADGTRASDAEREDVVAHLHAHAGDGRLSFDELEQRTADALTAATRSDLAALTADLPRPPRRRNPRAERAEFADHLRTYLMVMALLVAIWALTGAGYFWPVWPALGWGIGVLSHASSVRRTPPRALARPQP